VYYTLAACSYLLVILFWRSVTAPFIRQGGEESEFFYPAMILQSVTDFFYALIIGLSYKRQIPIGVYFHGMLLLVTGTFLVKAWSLEGH
jgi:hypothetical protein